MNRKEGGKLPERILDFIPFLMTVEGKRRLNVDQIIQAVIIAVIGGAFAGYIAVQRMEVKLVEVDKSVAELKQDMKKFYSDFYIPRGR